MSITFSQLGRMGRLGNQMFQYASLRGIAEFHGYHWVIPPSTGSNEWHEHRLFSIFEMGSVGPTNIGSITPTHTVEESSHCFDQNLFFGCLDGTDINGYLQSPKYFNHIRALIKSDFTFKNNLQGSVQDLIDGLGNEVISVHLRRTDYMALQAHHPPLALEYYEKAMTHFPNATFIVVSDDPAWCKEQEIFQGDNVFFPDYTSQPFDLCLMTLCDGNIISNSSFSWWGAWLNGKGNVVIPSTWFGPALADKDTSDYYVDGWTSV